MFLRQSRRHRFALFLPKDISAVGHGLSAEERLIPMWAGADPPPPVSTEITANSVETSPVNRYLQTTRTNALLFHLAYVPIKYMKQKVCDLVRRSLFICLRKVLCGENRLF